MEDIYEFETPKSVKLEEGERMILLVRQHWYVFRNSVLLALFVPFTLLFFAFMSGYLIMNRTVSDILQMILLWGAFICLILGLVLFLWQLFLWRRTFYIVTTKRLILITRFGLFHHDDRETALTMVQDVKAVVEGMAASLYGFGQVIVQVSSEDAKLIMHKVPKPQEVQRVIIREAHLRD